VEAAVTLSIFRVEETLIFSLVCPSDLSLTSGSMSGVYMPLSVGGETKLDTTLREQLNHALSAAVEQLQRGYGSGVRPVPGSEGYLTATLNSLGQFLFSYLLPRGLQDTLRRLPQEMPILIQTNESLLPWELLHDGQEYLALSHPVGRLLWSLQPISADQLPSDNRSFLFISNPTEDLDSADLESERLWDLFDPEFASGVTPCFMGRAHATKWKVLQALGARHELIHYSGHAKAGALVVADGELTVDSIRKALKGRPFVFLNGCWSVKEQTDQFDSRLGADASLASAFITAGAIGFVGTLWPVFDHSSGHFAEQFYAHVRQGMSVGEALRQTRRKIREAQPDDPIWASFVLYGDPRVNLMTFEPQETRSITVLVAHIEGFAPRSESQYEQALEMLEKAKGLLKQIAERYGGLVETPFSDTLKVYFGLPKAHGDDAEHACIAALDMIRALSAPPPLNPPQYWRGDQEGTAEVKLGLRVGISSGRVITLGSKHTSGVVSGTARRLAAFAEPGQIWVDQATSRLARSRLTFSALGPPSVRGALWANSAARKRAVGEVGEGESCYRVVGPRRVATTRGALFGRHKELAQLRQWWHEVATSGQGRLVGIMGTPGVGKTRLVEAFREEITGDHQWIGTLCHSYNKSQSVGLLAQVIRALADLKPDDSPRKRGADLTQRDKLSELVRGAIRTSSQKHLTEGVANLSRVIGLDYSWPELDNLPAKLRQKKLVRLIGALLMSRQTPLVLVLEDIQWADEGSLLVLNQLVNAIGRMRVLLLAIYRPDWSHNWGNSMHYRHLPLDDLTRNAGRSLVTHLLGEEHLEENVSNLILSQTGGHPFFIEEYVWLLQENGSLLRSGDGWTISAQPTRPSSVERVIQARLDRLPAESRQVIQTAAVIGEKFDDELLHTVLEKYNRLTGHRAGSLGEGLPLLMMRSLIYEEGGWPYSFYSFSHGLVHDIVYKLLPERFRRTVHRHVAQALGQLYDGEEEEILYRLAHHYYHGHDRVRAIPYLLQAAKRDTNQWANQTALEWYGRAQELIQTLRSKPKPLDSSGITAEQAIVPKSQMIEWQVEALEGQADVQKTIGQAEEAIKGYAQALELMATDASVTRRADLYHKLATAHHDKGQFDAAQDALNKGLEVLDGLECLSAGRLHIWKGMLYYRQGPLSAGLASCAQAMAIIEKTESIRDLAQAHNMQGLLYRNLGESKQAVKAYQQSLALYEQAEDLRGQERARANMGGAYNDLGKWEAAQRCFEKSRALSQRTGDVRRQAAVINSLGEIYRRQGKLEEAILAYEQARQILEELGILEFVGIALMNQGATYLKKGSESKARACLSEALSLFQRLNANVHLPEVLRYLAELELLSGNLTEALRLAQNALNLVSQQEHKLEEGQAKRVLGQIYRELGQLSEANTQLEESLTMLEERNNPYEIGLTLVELARLRTKESDGQQTAAYCKRAIAIFSELGAALDLKRAQEIRSLLEQ